MKTRKPMKHIVPFLFLLLGSTFSFAQNTSGFIVYDQVIHLKFDKSKMPPEAQQWVDQMPKEIKSAKSLLFTDEESLYRNYDDPDAVEPMGNDMGAMMRRNMPEDYTYSNIKEKRITDKKEMFGRLFLIKDDMETVDWKITGEQEEIAGFPCMRATTVNTKDSTEIVAWFTPSIPVPAGPGATGQLPGMILKMELERVGGGRFGGGQVVMTARDVEFRKVKRNEIEEPEKGKKVTQDEFREIIKEKVKEMRESGGGRHGGIRMH